jgi:3-oxoadipate enol-lactonase
MHTRIQGSILKVIEKAGHLPNMEQPQKFNAALREFLGP